MTVDLSRADICIKQTSLNVQLTAKKKHTTQRKIEREREQQQQTKHASCNAIISTRSLQIRDDSSQVIVKT